MNKKRSSQMVEEPVIGKKLSKKFPAILSPYIFFPIFEWKIRMFFPDLVLIPQNSWLFKLKKWRL